MSASSSPASADPYGNEYGLVAAIAATREEAIAKAGAKPELALAQGKGAYVPAVRYVRAIPDGLSEIREVENEVFIDWSPSERHR